MVLILHCTVDTVNAIDATVLVLHSTVDAVVLVLHCTVDSVVLEGLAIGKSFSDAPAFKTCVLCMLCTYVYVYKCVCIHV